MQSTPDWILLWRELTGIKGQWKHKNPPEQADDIWRARAHDYHEAVKRRWAKPDTSREFIVKQLDAHPGSTLLDIGAGTGAWTLLLAHHTQHVTAVDPSPAMLSVLQENLAPEKLTNVTVLQGAWPDVAVAKHDFTLCSHAMYGCADFQGFIEGMVAATQRTCFLLFRIPRPDGLLAAAARHIWGQPHDSPNFQVAYNALLQMGLYPNVLIEESAGWEPRRYPSQAEALKYIKHHFALDEDDTHDAFLKELLQQYLTREEDAYLWPQGTRSALVYWDV